MEIKRYELTAEQSESVAAGKDQRAVKTLMHCDECGLELNWLGDYMNGQVYICPQCEAVAFHGIEYC